jgi:hypothetical protein
VGAEAMPLMKFSQDFDWTDPRNGNRTVAYKAGHVGPVTVPCAVAALSAGRARRADLETAA